MTSALAGLSRTLAAQLPSAAPGRQVLARGLGPPPPGAWRGDVPYRAGPFGPGPGGGPEPRGPAGRAALRRGDRRRGHRRGHAQPGRAGRHRADRTADHAAERARHSRRRSTCGGPPWTPGCPRSWTTPPWPGGIRPGGRGGSWPPRRCAASGPRWTGSGSPRSRRRRSCRRPPSPAPTCSSWTTSGARPTWPSPRSSTSRRWSASSSGSTRLARCSGPSRTTPPATWPSTLPSTPSSASSATTATCWRCCGTPWPG